MKFAELFCIFSLKRNVTCQIELKNKNFCTEKAKYPIFVIFKS